MRLPKKVMLGNLTNCSIWKKSKVTVLLSSEPAPFLEAWAHYSLKRPQRNRTSPMKRVEEVTENPHKSRQKGMQCGWGGRRQLT